MLLNLIKNDKNWVQNVAITMLGTTHDAQYADLYISKLNDSSDRIVNAAAIALGKTKSPKAFDALVKLKDKPSWKNQSLISTLYAFSQLKEPKSLDIALNALRDKPAGARWTLATPVWDYRLAAAQTLVDLGKNMEHPDKVGTEGYLIELERYKKAIEENDLNDIFNTVLIITTLGDPRGQVVFDELKQKFKDNATVLNAVSQFETQFKEAIKK
jgi:HEAT repeat protein